MSYHSRAIRIVVLLLLSAAIHGCASYGPWHRVTPVDSTGAHDYPWCGPNQQVTAESRTINSPFATTSETRYWGCHRDVFDLRELVRSLEASLAKFEVVASWPRDYSGRIKEPADLVLVSVTPVIIVLCETDPSTKRHFYAGAFDSKLFVRGIAFSTTIFCKSPASWMDADLKVNIVSEINETTRRISFKAGEIHLAKVDNGWSSARK